MDINAMFKQFGTTGNAISNVFRDVEVVEEEIAKAKGKFPQRVHAIDDCFLAFIEPSSYFDRLDPKLFRSHVREILTRVGNNTSKKLLNAGTDAEIVLALMEESLKHPLGNDYACTYIKFFKKVLGEEAWELMFESEFNRDSEYQDPIPSYSSAIDEIENDLRRKLSRNRKTVPVTETAEQLEFV